MGMARMIGKGKEEMGKTKIGNQKVERLLTKPSSDKSRAAKRITAGQDEAGRLPPLHSLSQKTNPLMTRSRPLFGVQ